MTDFVKTHIPVYPQIRAGRGLKKALDDYRSGIEKKASECVTIAKINTVRLGSAGVL